MTIGYMVKYRIGMHEAEGIRFTARLVWSQLFVVLIFYHFFNRSHRVFSGWKNHLLRSYILCHMGCLVVAFKRIMKSNKS
jgi:hypothetical protein